MERELAETVRRPARRPQSDVDLAVVRSCFAVALHMHQPLIPAGGHDLQTAAVISNLQLMAQSEAPGSRCNASVYQPCYQRMGEILPALVHAGQRPRILLEYSGCLLHGLQQMGLGRIRGSTPP